MTKQNSKPLTEQEKNTVVELAQALRYDVARVALASLLAGRNIGRAEATA